ncbi:MAG: lysine-sensitive aspartokinase 3 [Spirochaetota bacterium]
MIVMKFGGSSVRNAAMIRQVVTIARTRLEAAPLLVSSAMGKTTDKLVLIAERAEAGDRDAAFALIDSLEEHHRATAAELVAGDRGAGLTRALDALFEELRSLTHGICLIRECSARSRDAILSFGERLSTLVIAAAARELGVDAELVDARALIRTDDSFGSAGPDMETTSRLAREALRPRPGYLYVTQGFIGATGDGVTTTLGRGGSDYSATILGASLGAESVEIWTDVDGIMTSDPRIIPEARTLASISYDEAAELAYFGARVVHPSTIVPAVAHSIPVWVKNTARPEERGTRIQADSEARGIRAIASKSGVTLVTVQSSRMLNAYGFLHALFSVFDRHRISIDLVATSEVSVSMTIDGGVNTAPVISELESLGEVSVEREKSIICLVGRAMLQQAGLLAEVFAAVEPVPVRMISLGSSDVNLSIVVPEAEAARVLRALHARLFPG